MKDKILAFLKTNEKLKGVQESYLSEVAEHYAKSVTEEAQIATTLTDGVVDLIKLNADQLQKEGDRRVNQAKLDLKNKLKELGLDEHGKPLNPDPNPNPTPDPKPDPNEPEWAKKLREEQAALKLKLDTAEKENPMLS